MKDTIHRKYKLNYKTCALKLTRRFDDVIHRVLSFSLFFIHADYNENNNHYGHNAIINGISFVL